MLIAIRHFNDRKRPCIVLEEGNKAIVIGYLTDRKREEWLRKAVMVENDYQLAIQVNSLYTLDEITDVEPQESEKYCDRNICVSNEYNGIGCDKREVTKNQKPQKIRGKE